MVVEKQFVSVIMDRALADKNDPKTAGFPGFSLIQNMYRQRVGEYRKRYGYDSISLTSGNYGSGANTVPALNQSSNFQFIDFEGTPALISTATGTNDRYIYRNITANNAWNAYAQSRIPKIVTTNFKDISNNPNFSVGGSDCAISGNTICVVYERANQIYASFYDAQSESVIRSDLLISPGGSESFAYPRVVVNGSVFQIFYVQTTSGGDLYTITINIATGALGSPIFVASDGDVVPGFYDVVIFNNTATIAYKLAAGGIRVAYVNVAGVVGTTQTILGENPLTCLTIYPTATHLYVVYDTTAIRGVILNTSLAITTSPTTLAGLSGESAGGIFACEMSLSGTPGIAVYYSIRENSTTNQPKEIRRFFGNTSFGAGIDALIMYSAQIITKGVQLNPGTDDVPFYYLSQGDDTGTCFVTEEFWTSALTGFGSGDPYKNTVLPHMPRPLVYGTKVITPIRKTLSIDFTGDVIYGIGLSIVETAPTHVNKITVNGVTVFGGGVVRAFDGYQTTELGWLGATPQPLKATVGSSGSMAAGDYQYVLTYEWVDVKGNVYQSPTSVPIEVTVGASGNVILSLEEYGVTTRNSYNRFSNTRGRINIFRTKVNGTVFYKLAEAELKINSGKVISYNDTAADAALSEEPLYTTGNILDDMAPPASSSINVFKGRVMLRPDEDKTKLWISKTVAPNTGVAFNNNLIIDFGFIGGDIVAHEEMDEKYIVIKRTAIYYIYGDGPDDQGQGQYSQPILLSKDTGCVDARSVVKTDNGIMFKTDQGIYLLNRQMGLEFIGAAVETHNDKTITSAENIYYISQVRFTTSEGTVLVYDTVFGEWYTWDGLASKSAGFWNSAYTILKTDGAVWRESTTSYLDNSTPFNCRLITFPIQMAQIQGYQRMFRILLAGEYRGEHKLIAQLAYDFKEYFEESFEIEPQSAVVFDDKTYQQLTYTPGGEVDNVWQFELRPARQMCQSVRLLIEDNFTDIDNPGNSFVLSSIGFEVGVLGGRNRVDPGTKVMTSQGG